MTIRRVMRNFWVATKVATFWVLLLVLFKFIVLYMQIIRFIARTQNDVPATCGASLSLLSVFVVVVVSSARIDRAAAAAAKSMNFPNRVEVRKGSGF